MRWTVVPGLAANSLVSGLRGYRNLQRELRAFDPDLVHAHSSVAGILARLVAARQRRPAVFTAQGWAFTEGARRTRRAVAVAAEWWLGRFTRAAIAVSAYDFRLGQRFRVVRSGRLHLVRNGIADLPAAPSCGGQQAGCRIIMTARFAPPKKHLLLVEALAGVDGEWHCELIGTGPGLEAVMNEVVSLGLESRFTFAGERDDVPLRLADGDLFVLVSDYEGLPISIIEAMRAGLAVAASDVGGVGELVEHEVSGLVFDNVDLEAVRATLQRLVSDGRTRARMGEAGRAAYESRHRLDSMIEATTTIYLDVLNGLERRRPTESSDRRCGDRTSDSDAAGSTGRTGASARHRPRWLRRRT